ncbi:MAG: hydroxymethylglutaryl-CoA synthase, partial [Pseudonocardiales bacterium]|nr:hydroxymethylglutaryl-CoA synthase [Pseudonocardiales bacterium]
MAVDAARLALRGTAGIAPSLWFTTTTPAYLDKTNASAIHAALQLDRNSPAYDVVGAVRSWAGAVRAGYGGAEPALVVASDVRTGLPGGSDESAGGDAAAALLLGADDAAPVLAEVVAQIALTEEFLDRWRLPAAEVSRTWEERFGEGRYAPLGAEVLKSALAHAGIDLDAVDHLIVAGLHERAVAVVQRSAGVAAERIVDRLTGTVGNPGSAQAALLLAATLELAAPGQTI